MATPLVKSAAGPSLQAAVSKMSIQSSSILFVDDDEAFSYAAAKELRAAGYEVWLAPDHRLALQVLESPQPLDLLITDIVMPNSVNGFALARMALLRRLELKVLYLTAFDLATEEAAGKILRKPVPLEVLALETRLALAGKDDLRASMHGGTT
jgi:CheY-like chemotaxis protein